MQAEIDTALARLADAVTTRRGPFRLAALATIDGDRPQPRPQVRTIIIRHFSRAELTLVFFCRADDAKYREIRHNPAVELMVYGRDPEGRDPDCQIRLAGTARIVTDVPALDRYWREVSAATRRDYVADGTVTAIGEARADLFAAIEVQVDRLKVLTFRDDAWHLHAYPAS